MNGISVTHVIVEPGGTGVVAHVGLHALGCFADRLGLGDSLSARIPPTGERPPVHDRGKVLVHAALMLAGGGESCADIEHLRLQPVLFGRCRRTRRCSAPSTSSTRRHEPGSLGPWPRCGRRSGPGRQPRPAAAGGLDIDASLVEVHTDSKEMPGRPHKGGFGFHPMFCFADATGEVLAGLLRPERRSQHRHRSLRGPGPGHRSTARTVAAGHRGGDDPATANRGVVVRADSAGCTEGFLSGCRARNVPFFVTARSNPQVTAAVCDAIGIDQVWEPALTQAGEPRHGAAVCELTSLVTDHKLPEGTRLIVRREPLHPGAQRSLFPSLEFRYWGFYTDAEERQLNWTPPCGPMPTSSCHTSGEEPPPLPDAVHQLRGQRHLDDGRGHECRPGALVPAAQFRWALGRRPTEGHALGHLPRPGPAHQPITPTLVRIIDGWPGTMRCSTPSRCIALITRQPVPPPVGTSLTECPERRPGHFRLSRIDPNAATALVIALVNGRLRQGSRFVASRENLRIHVNDQG